jgi:hypothetical protein
MEDARWTRKMQEKREGRMPQRVWERRGQLLAW